MTTAIRGRPISQHRALSLTPEVGLPIVTQPARPARWKQVAHHVSALGHVDGVLGGSLFRRGVVILLYHRVGPRLEPWLLDSIPQDVFAMQMSHLADHYEVVSLEAAMRVLMGDRAPASRLAVVTFDDGYADNYHCAMPALERHRIPATVFLSTANILTRTLFWTDRLRYIGCCRQPVDAGELLRAVSGGITPDTPWSEGDVHRLAVEYGLDVPHDIMDKLVLSPAQISEMRASGVSFGSHTRTHRMLSTTPPKALREELEGSLEDLRLLAPESFPAIAYPFGIYHRRAMNACADVGYACALTCQSIAPRGPANSYAIGRTEASPDMIRFTAQAAGIPSGLPGAPWRGSGVCNGVWRRAAPAWDGLLQLDGSS